MESKPSIKARDRAAWRAWLDRNAATSRGVWLFIGKKSSGRPSVAYEDAVEEAVCVGWVDGLVHRVDDAYYAVKFTPRGAKTRWSESNVARAEKMIRDGRMTEAGLAKYRGAPVHPARERLEALPPGLREILDADGAAAAAFRALAPSHRRMYVAWIIEAKRDETKLRRLRQAIERLRKGLTLGLK